MIDCPNLAGADAHRWIFLSDVPPCVGATGCHFIASNFCEVFEKTSSVLVTRAFSKKLKRRNILAAVRGMRVEFWNDLTPLGLRRPFPALRTTLDNLAFKVQVSELAGRLSQYNPTRIFALAGDNPYFLEIAVTLAHQMKLPLDMYLVDDFEASAKARGDSVALRWTQKNEAGLLRKCTRVWTISEGYAEHLWEKHSLKARFLPVPILSENDSVTPPLVSDEHVRRIIFVGSVNHLYLDSLVGVYRALAELNAERSSEDHPYRLTIFTLGDPSKLREMLGDARFLDVVVKAPDEERMRALSMAHAILLPYSFLPSEKLMVSTSFSCKTAEAMGAGRPILVYGPDYASVPRYFQKHELPLVVTSPALLREAILAIPTYDIAKTATMYADVAQRIHSPAALISLLNS